MKPDMRLDYAIFQLTPTRTRCELHVVAQGVRYKLASGLLKPFAAHLRAVEEQLARGGYSIRLEPPHPDTALWFTKNTMERFVRFVSTPEVLERVGSVEAELMELEETVNLQIGDGNVGNELIQGDGQPSKAAPPYLFTGGRSAASAMTLSKMQQELPDAVEGNSKQRLLRALDARQVMLQKEQGMAIARAIAAGFSMEQMGDLVAFATCFGATRLREACIKFMALRKKRQESGLWLDDLDLAAIDAGSTHPDMAAMGLASDIREYSKAWSNKHGQDMELDVCHLSFPNDGRFLPGEDGAEKFSRQGTLNDPSGEHGLVAVSMRPVNESKTTGDLNLQYSSEPEARNMSSPAEARNMSSLAAGRNHLTSEELQAAGAPSLISAGSGMDLLEERRGNDRETETKRMSGRATRGHPVMASWQGHPHEDQYAQSFHQHLGSAFGYTVGLGRGTHPGVPYPHYLVNPYMQPVYADISPWQTAEAWPNLMDTLQPPLPSHYFSGEQGNINGPQPNSEEFAEGLMHNAQHQEANSAHLLSIDKVHGDDTDVRQSALGSAEAMVDSSVKDTIYHPASKLSGHPWKLTEPHTPEHAKHEEKIESPHDIAADLPVATRRSPRRSSSPSRRSSSPMRNVRIGRSSSRRTGMVVIRNINYIVPNSQDRDSRDNKDALSSGSWSEDGDSHAGDQEAAVQSENKTMRVNVQAVIGRVDKKNVSNNARRKPTERETQKSSSEKAALRRWTKSGDARGEPIDEHQEDNTFTTIQGEGSKHDAEAVKGMKTNNDGETLMAEEASFSHDRVAQGGFNNSAHDVAVLVSKAENHLQTASQNRQPAEDDMLAQTEFTAKVAQSNMMEGQHADDMLILAREGFSGRSSHLYSTEVFAEQHGPAYQENPIADDSFMVLDRPGLRDTVGAGKSRTMDPDFEYANNPTGDAEQQPCDKKSLDDSFMVLNHSVAQEGPNICWKTSFNLESEMLLDQHVGTPVDKIARTSKNFEPDDLFMVPERNNQSVSRPWNSALDYDVQLLAADMEGEAEHGGGEHNDEDGSGLPLENGFRGEENGGKSKESSSKKSEREVKAKAMQAMLEKRKAAMGKRSDKATPVAEAQVRAEKRAYKASLQKGNKDKVEEEDKKRSEDLKKQRLERISGRSSSSGHGGSESASPAPRRVRSPATPALPISSKTSPTATRKFARESALGSPSASPIFAPARALNGIRPSPTPLPSPKPAQHPLSRSVPSLSELRKESRKTPPSVRASTGSLRLPQIKNGEKALDSASKDKKRPASTTTLRKGIPPTKGKGSPAVESSKPHSAASKQQKAAPNSKFSLQKEAASLIREAATEQVGTETRDVTDSGNEATPSSLQTQKGESEGDKQEASSIEVTNAAGPDEEAASENQIKASESAEVPARAEQSDGIAVAGESDNILEESREGTFTVDIALGSFPALSSQKLGDDGVLIGEAYHAPVAHGSSSSLDDNSDTFLELNLNHIDGPFLSAPQLPATSSIPLVPITQQYNPPFAPPTCTPVITPSQNLPRLQEAILQAHSPDTSPVKTESSRRKQKWGDSGFHVKGLKRLLLLGRKSSRSSAQNSSDWASGAVISEGDDEDGDVLRDLPSINGRKFGIASSLDSTSFSEQARNKLLYDISSESSESSSKKASRPFFSFPSFRNRSGERKNQQ